MKWQDAVEIIELRKKIALRSEPHDPELLKAANALADLVTKLMRRKKRMITVGDITLSLHDWAKRTGITPAAIYGRINSGWSEQDAVSIPHQKDGSLFGGKTLVQHAEESGLTKHCIYSRLLNGWTIEDAVSTPKHEKRKQS